MYLFFLYVMYGRALIKPIGNVKYWFGWQKCWYYMIFFFYCSSTSLMFLIYLLFHYLNITLLFLTLCRSHFSLVYSWALYPQGFWSTVWAFFIGTLASLSIIWLFENKNPNQPCIQLVLVTSQSWLSNLVTDQSHHFIGLLPSVNPRLMVLWALMISVAPS